MNVAFDPWIPVVTLGGKPKLASLCEVLTQGHLLADLSVRPHERVSLMRCSYAWPTPPWTAPRLTTSGARFPRAYLTLPRNTCKGGGIHLNCSIHQTVVADRGSQVGEVRGRRWGGCFKAGLLHGKWGQHDPFRSRRHGQRWTPHPASGHGPVHACLSVLLTRWTDFTGHVEWGSDKQVIQGRPVRISIHGSCPTPTGELDAYDPGQSPHI